MCSGVTEVRSVIQLRVRKRSSCFPAWWVAGVQQRQVEGSQKRLEVDCLRSFEVDVEVPKKYQRCSIIREGAEEQILPSHAGGNGAPVA